MKLINIGYREYARYFNLSEARELLPLIRQVTHETYIILNPIRKELSTMSILDDISPDLQAAYKSAVERWIEKMKRLGVHPVTLGVVNFDAGVGYLNWKYPEFELSYFQDYDANYKDRKPLEQVKIQQSHDWIW